MRASRKLIVLAGILALALAGIAVAAGTPGERFAQGSDRGQNPLAEAAGNIEDPEKIWARVNTVPPGQKIGAKWTTKCAKGPKLGTRGDTFVGTAPVLKKLRMRFDDPDLCQVNIITRMKGEGTVKAVLRATQR